MAITAHVTEKTEKQAAFDYTVPMELSGRKVKQKNRKIFYRTINLPASFASVKISMQTEHAERTINLIAGMPRAVHRMHHFTQDVRPQLSNFYRI
jgi:hypothetical protein